MFRRRRAPCLLLVTATSLFLLPAPTPLGAIDSFNYDLANATLAVVVDRSFRAAPKGQPTVLDNLKSYLNTATLQYLKHGGLNVDYYNTVDLVLRPDLTAVLTVANCDDTWRLYRQISDGGLLFFAITEADCPRLPASSAITVPLADQGGDLPQMVLDLKTSGALNWKATVILHDDTVSVGLLGRVISALSTEGSVSAVSSAVSVFRIVHDTTDWKRRKRIDQVLGALPISHLGSCFLVMVTYDLVGLIMDVAKSQGMVHPKSQWLYIVADTDVSRDSVAGFTSLLGEGDIVAFATNYTQIRENCAVGLRCHTDEMLRSFLMALDRSVRDEQELAGQVSDEEWEAIRPSKEDRMAALLAQIKEQLRETGQCDNCTAWRLRAGDTWGLTYQEQPPSREYTDSRDPRDTRQPFQRLQAAASTERSRSRNPLLPSKRRRRQGKTASLISASEPVETVVFAPPPRPSPSPPPSACGGRRSGAKCAKGMSGDEKEFHDESDKNDDEFEYLFDDHEIPFQGPRVWLRRRRPKREDSLQGGNPQSVPHGSHGDDGYPDTNRAGEYSDNDEDDDRDQEEEELATPPPPPRRTSRSSAKLVSVGWWRPRDGLTMEDSLFPHAAHGFRRRTLPLVSVHNPPWQIISPNETGHVVEYKGLVFEIINELAKNLNFSYTVLFPHADREGFSNETHYASKAEGADDANNARNISWDKMIDIVRQKKVFLGAGGFTVTQDRKQLINFTHVISVQPYQFLVVRPRELSRALLFMSPFTSSTWLCIAMSVAAIGPVLNYIHRASPFYDYHGKRTRGGLTTLTNCLWYAYGALLQQGGAHLPDADSGRLVVGTWWLVVLVLVTTYCGNLVAALTFPRMETSVHSVDELMERRDTLTWGFLRHSPLEEHLKTTDDPRMLELLHGARLHNEQDASVLEAVRSGTHVYIDWRVNLLQLMKKDFISNNRCDFSLEPVDDFLDDQIAMIMAQESPYLGLINEEIRRMHQVGLIHKWLGDYLPKKDRCWSISNAEANNHSVNLGDMQGSFFVLFLGFAFASFLILFECFWKKRNLARERRVIKPFVA